MGGVPVDDVVSGVFGETITHSRIVEVAEDGQICFDVAAREAPGFTSAATYQASRMPLFIPEGYQERLGALRAASIGEHYFVAQTDDFNPPGVYAGKLSARFRDIHRDGNRLVVDGTLLYEGTPRLIGRAYLIFRDTAGNAYVYSANSSISGRFLASVNVAELPEGTYALDIAGGLVDGNDALNDKVLSGHFPTEYIVTVKE